VASSSFFFSCYFSSFHCTKKETSEKKEGEKAPVQSQRKKEKKTFNSTAKETSAATLCLSPLLLLHKSRCSSEGHLDKLLLPFVLLFHHLFLPG
jgi:hypothetical protein